MDVREIDPRDTRWEITSPAYRVYFWRGLSQGGFASEEFELRGAVDVHEVLAWADAHADGRTYTAYACARTQEGPGLIHVAGVDPTGLES